jgi:protoporphyrinogen/coproporphyrinogen III oxidase
MFDKGRTAGRDADVIVVGGGIAGLGAALALRDRGLAPLVLEAGGRVGGRMTTDRVGGYAIDTGVTLLGNRFARMLALARRFDLAPAAVPFSLAVRESFGVRRYRARRFLDLVLDARLSPAARRAAVRLLADIVRARPGMLHGESPAAVHLGDETVNDYFARLGAGGQELLARVLAPGLRAALGGDPGDAARFVLMQVVWNTLGAGFWNLDGGVDRLPEALARQLPVLLGSRVERVRADGAGVAVDVAIAGTPQTLRAGAAILAVPGHLVPSLWPDAPAWIRETAARATFSRVASVHLGLSRAPDGRDAGCAFTDPVADAGEEGVGVLELEHLRAPGRCPAGRGMVSVYFVDAARFRCLEPDDDTLIAKARRVLARVHPESAGAIELAHVIRWPVGIAQFGRGRLAELAGLRERLDASPTNVDLAGDWLDGVASESALRTGEQAAARIASRLAARAAA